jgi:hypothetical protein
MDTATSIEFPSFWPAGALAMHLGSDRLPLVIDIRKAPERLKSELAGKCGIKARRRLARRTRRIKASPVGKAGLFGAKEKALCERLSCSWQRRWSPQP